MASSSWLSSLVTPKLLRSDFLSSRDRLFDVISMHFDRADVIFDMLRLRHVIFSPLPPAAAPALPLQRYAAIRCFVIDDVDMLSFQHASLLAITDCRTPFSTLADIFLRHCHATPFHFRCLADASHADDAFAALRFDISLRRFSIFAHFRH